MSDQDDDQGGSKFKKTAHRPWKASLLETTIAAAEPLEFNFTTPFMSELGQPEERLDAKPNTAISLGGFFQPQQLTKKNTNLIEDLKHKQQELTELTTNLKINEALERSEHAELNRRAEAQSRLSAENHARRTIEQAQTISEQFRKATMAYREEERLRRIVEDKLQALQLQLKNTEILLDNERVARAVAEQKSAQIDPEYEELKRNYPKIKAEHTLNIDKIYHLETELRNVVDKKNLLDNKLAEVTAQRDKLKTIIEAEQELRKNAEKRAQDSLAKYEQAEKARLLEVQQRKLIDERAKRAVEHANRTVMHLLNAPVGSEYSVQTPVDYATQEKIKIRVRNTEEDEVDNNSIY